ncbi:hypothetical protein KVT40_005548 [Elsinoe batatas]|uniref:Nucleoside phosphorylase domain-containing protein n=1 Tax=Elsinoe batatas TaxID=2601811 RepID=A0A8K0L6G2_9PEZI|nr:hypothetical protein KVT40_005548 [Elsinoe batatas]
MRERRRHRIASLIYTIGWICALSTEQTAARQFLDERFEQLDGQEPSDNNTYTLGRIGKHNVVIATCPTIGTTSAATVARDMVHTFPKIRIGLLVGVGGGLPSKKNDIRLGDVVVSISDGPHPAVIQYDMGKQMQDGSFQQTGQLSGPPPLLLTAINALRSEHEDDGNPLDEMVGTALESIRKKRTRATYQRPEEESDILFKSEFHHDAQTIDGTDGICMTVCAQSHGEILQRNPRLEDDDVSMIHYGPIASANRVLRDGLERDKLARQAGALCCEMEAAGVMNHWPCVVVRGICDYADSHESKEWQGYAAMVAAAYAKTLLLRIAPNRIEQSETMNSIMRSLEAQSQSITHINEKLDAASEDRRQSKWRSWLSPVDPSTNFSKACSLRHEYCARYWTVYGRGLLNVDKEVQSMAALLFEPEVMYERWLRLYDPDRPWEETPKSGNKSINALYCAAATGLIWKPKLLIEESANVDGEGGHKGNAIKAAIYHGHEAVVKLLIEKGATINAEGGEYGNSLLTATLRRHKAVVKLLIEEGADVNAEGGVFGNAFQAAIYKGDEAMVSLLIEKDADVNASSMYTNALQNASFRGYEAILKLLIEKGADVNAGGA